MKALVYAVMGDRRGADGVGENMEWEIGCQCGDCTSSSSSSSAGDSCPAASEGGEKAEGDQVIPYHVSEREVCPLTGEVRVWYSDAPQVVGDDGGDGAGEGNEVLGEGDRLWRYDVDEERGVCTMWDRIGPSFSSTPPHPPPLPPLPPTSTTNKGKGKEKEVVNPATNWATLKVRYMAGEDEGRGCEIVLEGRREDGIVDVCVGVEWEKERVGVDDGEDDSEDEGMEGVWTEEEREVVKEGEWEDQGAEGNWQE